MKNLLLVNDTNYWNKAEGVDLFNDFLTKLDKENTNLEIATFVNKKGTWTGDLEHMKTTHINDSRELIKHELKGLGTYVTGSFSFCGKNVLSLMKEGYVLIISHEVTEILNILEKRAIDLKAYGKIQDKIGAQETKIKEFKGTKKEFEDLDLYKVELEKKELKLTTLKEERKNLKDSLSIGQFSFQFLNFETTYLLKAADMIYCNKSAGVAFFKINKKSNFNYKEFDALTLVADKFKEEKVKDFKKKLKSFFKEEVSEIEEDLKNQEEDNNIELKCLIKPFASFTFKIKIPLYTQDMSIIQMENVMNIDIKRTVSMEGSVPMAPVKASIAAAMLASGVGGKLNKSVIKNNEESLIKTAIAPIQMTETVSVNGINEVRKTFSWEPQLGQFNKLRKEFVILR